MNIIVLQHIKIEDPGYIKDLMLADGLNLTTIELDEGEKIPNDLSKFDGMFWSAEARVPRVTLISSISFENTLMAQRPCS